MEASNHWLEVDRDGREFHIALRNDRGVIGAEGPTPVSEDILEHLAESGPGVIIRIEPLSFYKTDEDVRVSFIEDSASEEDQEPIGFDRLDTREFDQAIRQVLGRERHSKAATPKKRAASKPKRHVTKSSKRAK